MIKFYKIEKEYKVIIWYCNGKVHREDGPAIEWDNGDKAWYFNGKAHREDSPAFEWADGYKEWWINGERKYYEFK